MSKEKDVSLLSFVSKSLFLMKVSIHCKDCLSLDAAMSLQMENAEGLMPVSYYDKILLMDIGIIGTKWERQHLTTIMIYASLLLPLRIA